ncbi:MAG: DUF2341 domain-containing protein [Cellvibrionaceae bacterium]
MSQAWWNDDWPYRSQINIDASITGANISETMTDTTVLIKLHSGNFDDFFLLKNDLSDLRFIAGDDQTPLKYHVEHFDLINQFVYIWVKVPKISGGINTEKIWMYYGNESAVKNEDKSGSYDAHTALIYHFSKSETLPLDATAYSANATEFTGETSEQSHIAAGAIFNGSSLLKIPDLPSFEISEGQGLTISFWLKADANQKNIAIFERSDGNRSLTLSLNDTNISAHLTSSSGETYMTPDAPVLSSDSWHHIGLILGNERMSLYVDGSEVSYTPITLLLMSGDWIFGDAVKGGKAFQGTIDELRVDNTARNPAWIKTAIASQGMMNTLLKVQPAEQLGNGGGGDNGMWAVLLKSTGETGWTVIIALGIMAGISWIVMFGKFFYIQRVLKQNQGFLAEFREIGNGDPTQVDKPEDGEDFDQAPITQALFGRGDHYQSSPIYRLYHRGVQDVKSRVKPNVSVKTTGLKRQNIEAIKASLDAQMIREAQRLNSQMVLLTIAISGGPFLGLLGTVLGVMITFAAIALTGDVNISAIAPGVAAALLTTVAGLIVAIPALFGYNYLATRIKESIADMRVFSDEFITRIAEYYAK